MRRLLRPSLALVSALAPLALAGLAAAQDVAAAEALFNKGLADMQAGQYETGCKAIAESQRLDPRAGTLFTLAVCETRWGRIASAVTHFGDYLALYDKLPPDQQVRQRERPKVARDERKRLRAEVPELTLSLPPGAPAGTVVKRGGVTLGAAALGVALPVDPGEYTVSTQAPGGPVREERITLQKGEKKQITLEVEPAAPAAPPPTAPPPAQDPRVTAPDLRADEGPSGRRMAAYVAGGVGVAGLVLGGVTGALALGEKGTIEDNCGGAIQASDEAACNAAGLDAADRVKTVGLLSTIGFGVGAAGVGTALLLLLTEPDPSPTTGKRSRWMSAGVLSAGPDGAVLGARGAW